MGRIMLATSASTDEEYGGTFVENETLVATGVEGVSTITSTIIEKIQKLVCGTLYFQVVSAPANTWTKVGTINASFVNGLDFAVINGNDGTYAGMIMIRKDGEIRLYPKTNISNNSLISTFIQKTT